jgi:hypothetical protein
MPEFIQYIETLLNEWVGRVRLNDLSRAQVLEKASNGEEITSYLPEEMVMAIS